MKLYSKIISASLLTIGICSLGSMTADAYITDATFTDNDYNRGEIGGEVVMKVPTYLNPANFSHYTLNQSFGGTGESIDSVNSSKKIRTYKFNIKSGTTFDKRIPFNIYFHPVKGEIGASVDVPIIDRFKSVELQRSNVLNFDENQIIEYHTFNNRDEIQLSNQFSDGTVLLKFLNANKKEVKTIGEFNYNVFSHSTFIPTAPKKAKYLEIRKTTLYQQSEIPLVIPLFGNELYKLDFTFLDQNSTKGEYSGTVKWKKYKNEKLFNSYGVYQMYTDAVTTKKLGTVKANGSSTYSFKIKNLKANSLGIAIAPEVEGSYVANIARYTFIDRNADTIKPIKLKKTDITLKKQSGKLIAIYKNNKIFTVGNRINIYKSPTSKKAAATVYYILTNIMYLIALKI